MGHAAHMALVLFLDVTKAAGTYMQVTGLMSEIRMISPHSVLNPRIRAHRAMRPKHSRHSRQPLQINILICNSRCSCSRVHWPLRQGSQDLHRALQVNPMGFHPIKRLGGRISQHWERMPLVEEVDRQAKGRIE